ncbi:hypothetical protein E5Q_03083 [Mixia osmundae IAM 14324]|uniref:Uncharacterized protein n=1 Tax=Mixia osmundae (strain CBS 9802 / IAM 14324 / JCM 22182 / KY 12970) TaxID=764103 RepID=G7E0Q6_MIXOS|nr:hypothetical protein E5Q_03083 [Mixia osmundae IAM 14324]
MSSIASERGLSLCSQGYGRIRDSAWVTWLSHAPLNEQGAIETVRNAHSGAICCFIGTTRDSFEGKQVTQLAYESYESKALKTMSTIAQLTRQKALDGHFSDPATLAAQPLVARTLQRITIQHRLDIVPPGETSIIVAVACPHRYESDTLTMLRQPGSRTFRKHSLIDSLEATHNESSLLILRIAGCALPCKRKRRHCSLHRRSVLRHPMRWCAALQRTPMYQYGSRVQRLCCQEERRRSVLSGQCRRSVLLPLAQDLLRVGLSLACTRVSRCRRNAIAVVTSSRDLTLTASLLITQATMLRLIVCFLAALVASTNATTGKAALVDSQVYAISCPGNYVLQNLLTGICDTRPAQLPALRRRAEHTELAVV